MLELKTIEELKPNTKLLELIKDFTYKTKKEKVQKNCKNKKKTTKYKLTAIA